MDFNGSSSLSQPVSRTERLQILENMSDMVYIINHLYFQEYKIMDMET